MKSKQEEIDILTEAARQLGEGSYCGPWLYSIIPEIEDSIKSDLLPAVSWIERQAEDTQRRAAVQAAEKDRAEAAQALRDAHYEHAKAAAAVAKAKELIESVNDKLFTLAFHLNTTTSPKG